LANRASTPRKEKKKSYVEIFQNSKSNPTINLGEEPTEKEKG